MEAKFRPVTESVCMAAGHMPDDVTLQPPTWRQWWLARPKWLRIGLWAIVGVVLLHVALVIRMAIGQIEDRDITQIRERGAEVHYSWLPRDRGEYFSGYERLNAGLWGRSSVNVVDLDLAKATDADLKLISSRFPNLKRLWLSQAEVTEDGLTALQSLQKLWFLGIEDSEIGDHDVEGLIGLDSLYWLSLQETRVTDDAIPLLQGMKSLEIVGVQYTDISMKAISEWRKSRKIRIDTEQEYLPLTDLSASFRWSDGRRNQDFVGPFVVGVEGPTGD